MGVPSVQFGVSIPLRLSALIIMLVWSGIFSYLNSAADSKFYFESAPIQSDDCGCNIDIQVELPECISMGQTYAIRIIARDLGIFNPEGNPHHLLAKNRSGEVILERNLNTSQTSKIFELEITDARDDEINLEFRCHSLEDCLQSEIIPITTSLSYEIIKTDISCFDANDGEIRIDSDGLHPFKVSWPNGQTDLERTDLAPGTYLLHFETEDGCDFYENVEIQNAEPITIEVIEKSLDCNGEINNI